ncbi:hypothetical protein NQ318_005192 [Aromia moschata]|uniref:Uncharacterized protein n=1 Tax=Aromia moschata TaxID=1265417 RepID=A0AAV8YCW3_9CUCU|nr:hypothetical protein NQ318_005192 [Aromia moschata]
MHSYQIPHTNYNLVGAGHDTHCVSWALGEIQCAELVSVESKEIESHYVLAREPIHKWNSSSDCYLLIEGVEHTLQWKEEKIYKI